jgi:hypothetical protein
MHTNFDLMMYCVIFHNMIIEDEKDQNLKSLFDQTNISNMKRGLTFQICMKGTHELKNYQACYNLKIHLVEHLKA